MGCSSMVTSGSDSEGDAAVSRFKENAVGVRGGKLELDSPKGFPCKNAGCEIDLVCVGF